MKREDKMKIYNYTLLQQVDCMDWIERMNSAINYIEEHIIEELDLSSVAQIVCTSVYHFQRMFICMTGVPISEYIRRRRMSLAVADLKNNENKIIDVASKYGYSSPTAFNRAFQSIHDIAPSLVKQDGVSLKSYPPISFTITIKGVEGLNYRIEKKESFRIVGVSVSTENGDEDGSELMSQLWDISAKNGTISKLTSMMDSQPTGLISVMVCNDTVEEWRFYAAVSSTKDIDGNLEEYTIPSYTWVIFSGEGKFPDASTALWERIFAEWLPTSGYEYDNGPDMEVYLDESPQNTRFEIWLPVKKLK